MRFDVITLFPEQVQNAVNFGITGRAINRGIVDFSVWNPRDYTNDRHRTVDDRPFGGGPGMVMKYQPLVAALSAAKASGNGVASKVVYMSPQGKTVNQALLAEAASNLDRLILIAGRYEGIDERFIETECDDEWSLGDFVISGGELAALVVIDGVTRLLPGALGDQDSAAQDSYSNGLLDYPHYTRPEQIAGRMVPEVLLSGNHANIQRWRLKQALGRTWLRRADLLQEMVLTPEQSALLNEFKTEFKDIN